MHNTAQRVIDRPSDNSEYLKLPPEYKALF